MMMFELFTKRADLAYAVMRIFFGVLFAFHGAQKLFGVLGGSQAESALMWVAGAVEFFGGLAIAIGIVTHLAAFLCAGEMLVGYLMSHAPNGLLPIQNHGELALLYFFGFVFIMTRGGGKWSFDGSKAR